MLMYTNSTKGTVPLMRLTTWAKHDEKNLPDKHAALACPVIL